MADLSTKSRNALPASKFGMPGSRKYPMPDKAHARAAKSMAARFASPAQQSKIDAKADRVLGKGAVKARAGRK